MMLSPEQCYQAILTRDSRFDGRFFVAVRTTRIYCRPICRVKTPMQKNCRFFLHAAEAEAAGFRPCKRCRPELAPGKSPMEISSHLARTAAHYIAEDFLGNHSLADLAEKIGITDRQMRRVFRQEFGVSPVEFWQTQRLLLAKQLLTDSALPVTSVALASGFQSLRRFNALLKSRYRMSPTELRRGTRKDAAENFSDFSFRVAYRPPLDWPGLLHFLGHRAIPGVEAVQDQIYFRTIRPCRGDRTFAGYLRVSHEPEQHMLAVRLSDGLLPVCAIVLQRVRRLFDLHADPQAIQRTLGPLAETRAGLRVPGCVDGFEMATRAILGQQISVAGARTLAGRVAARFGTPISTPMPALTHVFPSAECIASLSPDQIASLGITGKRAQTLLALARAVTDGNLQLQPGGRIEDALAQLRQISGIGEWTAQYIAMRALSWPDAFPHTDLGIRKALGGASDKKILQIAEQWRPWRAYAALHLWSTLEKPSCQTVTP